MVRLDGAWSNLVWWKVSLQGHLAGVSWQGEWNEMTFKASSNTNRHGTVVLTIQTVVI